MGTGQNDAQAGHGTYNDGIDEGAGHGNKTLTCRLVGLSGSGSDRCASQTCLIGEDTSGNSFLHCDEHGTEGTAGSSTQAKGALDDLSKRSRDAGSV